MQNGDWALCFLNRSKHPQTVEFKWKEQVVNDTIFSKQLDAGNSVYKIRDQWTKKDIGTTKKDIKTIVPAHDVLMLRLSATKSK